MPFGLKILRATQVYVASRYKYVPDERQYPEFRDHWRQHWDKLNSDPEYIIRGDCDDFACTVAEGLLRQGWPRDKLWLLAVSANRNGKVDHLVTMAEVGGDKYTLGDIIRHGVTKMTRALHEPIYFMRCDKPGKWFEWNETGEPPKERACTMTAFDKAFEHTVGVEGGYSNHKDDSGGKTRFGITEKVARANGYEGLMRELPIETAKRIYKSQYWDVLKGDEISALSEPIAAELFDTGVNTGTARAARFLQRALNALNKRGTLYRDMRVDGVIGPVTVASLKSFLKIRTRGGEAVMLAALNSQQCVKYLQFAEADESQENFIYGWLLQRVS